MATDFQQVDRAVVRRLRTASALLVGDEARLRASADLVDSLLAGLDADLVADYWNEERVLPRAVARADSIGLRQPAWQQFAAEARADPTPAIQELVARQITAACAKEGIPVVVLKGAAMARQLYSDPSLRQASGDVDLLVPVGDLWRASAAIQRLGWDVPVELAHGASGAPVLPDHHLSLFSPGDAPEVELHWRVQWYEPNVHAERVLGRAEPLDGVLVPSPVDTLTVLLLAYLRDGLHRLRLAADIAAWWETFGVAFGDEAQREIGEGPLERPQIVAAQAAAAVVSTPEPRAPRSDRRARLAVGLAVADRPVIQRRFYSQVALVDVLSCPDSLRGARVRSSWFRDPLVLRARYPHAPEAAVPILRVISAAQTSVDGARLAARARRR